jgi:hypothetical protein
VFATIAEHSAPKVIVFISYLFLSAKTASLGSSSLQDVLRPLARPKTRARAVGDVMS